MLLFLFWMFSMSLESFLRNMNTQERWSHNRSSGSDYATVMQWYKSLSFCFGHFPNILKGKKNCNFDFTKIVENCFAQTQVLISYLIQSCFSYHKIVLFICRGHLVGFYEQDDVIIEKLGAMHRLNLPCYARDSWVNSFDERTTWPSLWLVITHEVCLASNLLLIVMVFVIKF